MSYQDINFIKKKKLKAHEIAAFSDGNYTTLSEIEIFKIYELKQMRRDFKKILYNSLINKRGDYFYSLFYHPGNILKMIKLYRDNKEFKNATKSFIKFLNLSMFNLKLNRRYELQTFNEMD